MLVFHLIKTSKGAKWALELIKEQKIKNPEIRIAVALPKGGKLYADYEKVCDYVYEMDYNLNYKLFSNGLKLRVLIKQIKPHIIHSWFTQTTLFARVFLRDFQIPRVFQVVGPAHLNSKLFKWFDVKSANNRDYWIATSKFIRDKYIEYGVNEKRVFLNYVFIDAEKLLLQKEHIVPINYHKKYNLPINTKILGTASYIYSPKFYQTSGIKAHEQLINSFATMSKIRSDIVLIIAGEPFNSNQKYLNQLKKLAANKCPNKIFFTGSYKNVYEVIGNFDLFVYLSKMENLGGVFESLLFKIPTVSSNSGGLPELVINKETGLTSNYNDLKAVSQNMNILIENSSLQEKFKKKGFQQVFDIFNTSFIVSNSLSIYLSILNNGKN